LWHHVSPGCEVIIDECKTIKSAVSCIKKHNPNLIIIEIMLSGINVFELIDKIENIGLKKIIIADYFYGAIYSVCSAIRCNIWVAVIKTHLETLFPSQTPGRPQNLKILIGSRQEGSGLQHQRVQFIFIGKC